MRNSAAPWMWIAVLLVGCGAPAASPPPVVVNNPPPPAPPAAPAPGEEAPAPKVEPKAEPEPKVETQEAEDRDLVKAEAGVGNKGRGYGGGIITEPIRQRFIIQDRLTFDTIQHAMKLYEASNGHRPKTHEEFMREIIQANQIQLPQLPEGEEYLYDPQSGELMVSRPKAESGEPKAE